jgi:ankyrin repeat protein
VSPIWIASHYGSIELARMLIEAGANVNIPMRVTVHSAPARNGGTDAAFPSPPFPIIVLGSKHPEMLKFLLLQPLHKATLKSPKC